MLMANLQMGVFNLGINGVLLSNSVSNSSSTHRFSVPWKPVFRIALNSIAVETSWVFDARAPKPTFRNALASGSGSLEKEVEFSPSFDDYVKVMESIRTDRSKNSRPDIGGYSSKKKRLSGKDASRAPDGEGELARSKQSSFMEKSNDHDGRRGRNSKDAREAAKSREHDDVESSGNGWGLVEDILEKATAGRSGVRSDGGLKDRRSSSLRKFNGSAENVGDAYFKKKEAGSGSNLENWKDRRGDGTNVQRVDEFRIPDEAKDALGHGNYGKLRETKRVGSVFGSRRHKLSYDDTSSGFQEGEMGDSEISENRDKHVYKSRLERKISGYRSKNLLQKESSGRSSHVNKSEDIMSAFENDKFYRSGTNKKSNDFDTHKNKWKDEVYLKADRRKTNGYLRRSETKILEKDTKQKHANDMEENRVDHGTSQNHVRFRSHVTDTKNLASRDIEIRGGSGVNDWQYDRVTRRDMDVIHHDDRAAFRTFEVFTDVRNRPRVLRMEMEERIEKLAKWLNATDVNMPEWQFSKMMHNAEIKFTDHSILRVVQILGALGNWKRVLQVVEWLHSRERFKSYKSRYIYTTVLDVLGKAKRPIEALNIFYAMRQELSSYPDLASYHCIAVILGKAGLMKELFDVIDCMRAAPEKKFKLGPLQKWDPRLEPDLVIYNAVLNACVQQKQWEGAFWVLQQLKKQGIKPTNTTYGLAMEVMLACCKYNLVHEFFRKVEKTSIPGALNYKVLVNTLWREGKVDEAVNAVHDMERRGIVGSASLYYDLARCLCSAGRCQEALLQINKVCKVAKKPLVVTYTGLIQACLDSGSIENGAYIFNHMCKFCSPNVVTCNIMLKSYLEHGMFDEAKELFHKILDGSHHFDSKADLRQRVIPDKFMFNTMMEACAATKNWDDFENVYQQMLHHGFHFDTRRHMRMVLDAFRAGKGKALEATWEHLVRSGRVPPPPIVKERFCMKLEEDDHLAAIACIGTHQEIDMQAFSEKSWLNLIESNADRFKKDTIVRLAHEVSNSIAESDQPHPVLQNLFNVCTKFVSLTRTLVNFSEDHWTL